MSFPLPADEAALHERVLQRQRVAPADVFQAFMEPIIDILAREVGCTPEEAYDSAVDAIFAYTQEPERYEPRLGRLSTYLTRAAKNQALDRRRSAMARARREQEFAEVVELQARTPKEVLETNVEAGLAVERLAQSLKDEGDRDALRLVLHGEKSTERLAEAFGLASLPRQELRLGVKRRRDRLMKRLERFGKESSDGEP